MSFNPKDDKEFWWYAPHIDCANDDLVPVIANWHEARRYNLNAHCESCGATYVARGGRPGYCPSCGSDYTERLCDVWEDFDNPWIDDDYDVDDIEENRITNYPRR